MKIVIIGIGMIGEDILQTLLEDNHTITIIDEDKNLVERLIEKYDVQGVVGNGAAIEIQTEADMKNADIAIVMTNSDELNIFACLVAKTLGVKNTVARVRKPEYRHQILTMKNELGISLIINPELDTAKEIFNFISLPAIAEIERFANGKVLLVGIKAHKDCTLIGKTLSSIGQELKTKVLICAIQRGTEIIIPSGDCNIQFMDKIYFTAKSKDLRDFLSEINIVKSSLKNIMIIGGSKTAYYLAEQLSQKRYNVKLLEKDLKVAEELAEKLPHITVINGSGTQHDVLLEEGLDSMDAFIALTNADEDNLLSSMFANSIKVKKVITKIENDDWFNMLSQLNVQNAVSPKNIVADSITSYVRALNNSRGSNIVALYRLVNGEVEALEFVAKKQEKFYGKQLSDLRIKKNCLIACIIRNGQVIIPDGKSSIQLGDNIIVITTHKKFDDLTDIFE